jgi:hypothetical protein
VPPLRIPDPSGFRRETASRISLSVFETELAPFGDPPVAPTKAAPDVVAAAESLYAQAVVEVSRFRFARRRRLRELAVTEAHDLVRRETQRLAEERERQQVDLDRKDRLRQALRTSLEQMVAKWLVEQRAIAEADHTRAVARAEVWAWRLRANDPTTLREALGPEILGAHVRVGAVVDGIVELVVHFAELERLISEHEPAVTPNGRLTVKKRPLTRRNELYAAAVASELLRLSRLSFARAPAVTGVHFRVQRRDDGNVIYQGLFARSNVGLWGDTTREPDGLRAVLNNAQDVAVNNQNRTAELRPIGPV